MPPNEFSDQVEFAIKRVEGEKKKLLLFRKFWLFEIKYFFSESITNIDGDEISTREVKKILQELINAEDKRNPLNDEQLVDMLRQHGYSIARRTVAKYRDMLNIPVARLRKML